MTQQRKTAQTEEPVKEPIKVTFSVPQIVGGALAAATAAAIGSQLGVAGTIIGASVASIIGGIAGTLYSAGIDRTHRKVSEAIIRGYDRVRDDVNDQQASAAEEASLAGLAQSAPVGADSEPLDSTLEQTRVDLEPVPAVVKGGGRKRILVRMATTIAAIFVVALLVVTAVEFGLGRSFDGSPGTTIGQANQRSQASSTTTVTTTATSQASSSASSTQSQKPSPTPTNSPTPTPVSSPTPTVSESGAPTPTASST